MMVCLSLLTVLIVHIILCQVELELGINTNSTNYYTPRGEQIAQQVSGGQSEGTADNYYSRLG